MDGTKCLILCSNFSSTTELKPHPLIRICRGLFAAFRLHGGLRTLHLVWTIPEFFKSIMAFHKFPRNPEFHLGRSGGRLLSLRGMDEIGTTGLIFVFCPQALIDVRDPQASIAAGHG